MLKIKKLQLFEKNAFFLRHCVHEYYVLVHTQNA